jgi:hypothetical protein
MYRVYVLRLQNRVWEESPKFQKRNRQYRKGKPVVYVGSTGKSIDERVADHLGGGKTSNSFVKRFFKGKMPKEFNGIRPRKSRAAIEKREARKAEELRERGWGVWQG